MLEWSPAIVLVVVMVITAVIAALLSVLSGKLAFLRGPDGSVSHVLGRAVGIAAAGTGLLALVTVSPPLAMLAVLLVLLTSPSLITLLTRPATVRTSRRHGAAAQDSEPLSGSAGDPAASTAAPTEQRAVSTLSDHELLHLWRRTFWDLRGSSGDDRLRVISLRQACLEELEKRDPEGLSAWLESGARASGGPERFWHLPSPPRDDDGD